MKSEKIKTEEELCNELEINDIKEIEKSEKLQAEVARLLKNFSPELLKNILEAIPELSKTFQATISAMENIGTSLEKTKQARWEVLRELAKTGKLNGDQILEAMRIIQEIEKNESIDWDSIFDTAIKILGGIFAGVASIALVVGGIILFSKEE